MWKTPAVVGRQVASVCATVLQGGLQQTVSDLRFSLRSALAYSPNTGRDWIRSLFSE